MKIYEYLWPYPQELKTGRGSFPFPREIRLTGQLPANLKEDLKKIGKFRITGGRNAYPLKLKIDRKSARPEGYVLKLSASGASLAGADKHGLSYGIQTLLQLSNLFIKEGVLPELTIRDWPAFKKRCFMVDMGRTVFPMPLLKRIVRILSRLKMNQLHLHLYDDELCGIRFKGLPFGKENPHAITIAGLKELIEYAGGYNIEVIPELEAWGHANSITYHRTDLIGGTGKFGGSSFLICEKTFELMKELMEQVIRVMPPEGHIHLGLDEAKWYPGPDLPEGYKPEDMIRRYHDILHGLNRKYNKKIKMIVWADSGGRPIPKDIQHNIIIQPWGYWNVRADDISAKVARYSGKNKMKWIAGGGQSMGIPRGSFHATRQWCKKAMRSPNIEGVNITFWGWNDLENKFISLFGGAYYLWNPSAKTEFADLEDYEDFDSRVFRILFRWQGNFRDAFPSDIARERGPLVCGGYYYWGNRHLKPYAPTAAAAGTFKGHDYQND
ncbi:MAG: hypothetical protein A2297_04435 [Elusimicrobia bacterium RIFOXYB2_FULL_48_7]|nr:MAG: hypothetical protein A2297_04435 [Elusimicrobia bacterium RIFOXYB2_FULL_48_7]